MLGVQAKGALLHGPAKSFDLRQGDSPGCQDVESRVHVVGVKEQHIKTVLNLLETVSNHALYQLELR